MILEFLNTEWKRRKTLKDPLLDFDWVESFVERMGLGPLSALNSNRLIAFRATLLEIIQEVVHNKAGEEEWITFLNDHLKTATGTRKIHFTSSDHEVVFDYVTQDLRGVIAELSYQFYDLIFRMDKSRIRICENPDCEYIFYDDSKNRSKRHCHAGCSNIMKVRRYRERQKI